MKSIFEITVVILLLGVGVMWVWGDSATFFSTQVPKAQGGAAPVLLKFPFPITPVPTLGKVATLVLPTFVGMAGPTQTPVPTPTVTPTPSPNLTPAG